MGHPVDCRYLPRSVKVSPHFLDSKFKDVCLFAQVGSYSYDDNRMLFDVSTLGYIQQSQSITLDYKITINNLNKRDQIFNGGALGNFSLAGFEMVGIRRARNKHQSVEAFSVIVKLQRRFVESSSRSGSLLETFCQLICHVTESPFCELPFSFCHLIFVIMFMQSSLHCTGDCLVKDLLNHIRSY